MAIVPMRRPHWLSRETFATLLQREAPLPHCVHCGSKDDLAIDHIIPRWDGGTDDIGNLQILCRVCNSKKGIREDVYWAQQFYWDYLPSEEGRGQLRESQRQFFAAIDQNPYFERGIGEIARLLYICGWVVGSGKTIGLAVAPWAINHVIRRKWGRAARRVDRPLVLCKEQAIRDQIAYELPDDLVKYGIVQRAPRIERITDSDQFHQHSWMDEYDMLVCCIQQLYTKNNTPRPDLARILARFPLLEIDEPHWANDQVSRIVDAAASSISVGYTGSPITGAGALLQKMVLLHVYDYDNAVNYDKGLKYLNDDSEWLEKKFVRIMNVHDAAITIGGTSAITTTTDHQGYDKNIEPVKAVVRGVIEEVKARDELQFKHEGLAPHRRNVDNVRMAAAMPWAHAGIYLENIVTAEAMARNTNELFLADPIRYPREMGYWAEVVHAGDQKNHPKPLARKPSDPPHPWMRCQRNGGELDSKCARFCFFVGIGREGVNNPLCALTGVALSIDSILNPVQGWIGRQFRSVIRKTEDGFIEVPPEPLDTVRIITHEAFDNIVAIRAAIKFLCNMRDHLAGLRTIDDLDDQDPPTAPQIPSSLYLTRNERIEIAGWMAEKEEATGQVPPDEEVVSKFASEGGRRSALVKEWSSIVRGKDPGEIRRKVGLDRGIEPWVVVRRERLRHEPSDETLERLVRVHHPELSHVLPIEPGNIRDVLVSLHQKHVESFQFPPITPHTTINDLARQGIGGNVKRALGAYYQGPNELVWSSAVGAVKRKLGVPREIKLRNNRDWDTPQCHAIIQRPDVQMELSNWVINRLLEHCPKLRLLRAPNG